MQTYTTVNYSDIYDGEKPSMEELLDGINSKIVIVLMAMINSELSYEKDEKEIQKRITLFVLEQFPIKEVQHIFKQLKIFEQKATGPVALWGKRYALELMQNEFINYRDGDRITNTPEEGVRIFKAYLLNAEKLNERDREELAKVTDAMSKDEPYFFEKLVWPFILKQFNTNERVNPISQMFRLFALIKYSITQPELLESWKGFIDKNGFKSLRTYLGSVNFLITVTQKRFPENKTTKVFSWIKANDLPIHLNNLSFDQKLFATDKHKRIDFLGMRERPLFKTDEDTFVILDIDYLVNKIYNGPLFDMYKDTDMATNTQFKSFPDFKTHIATEVSENIVFKGVLNKMFNKKNIKIHFDDTGRDNCPDCYIRSGKKIFLIEFKDYLFPGKLVDKYSFDEIKKHIDIKFVKNEKGKNKGISQIMEQLKILEGDKFEFDLFTEKNIIVYPIIIHTNFTYQMPGINHYLNDEFKKMVHENLRNLDLQIQELVLFDLDSLFEFFQIQNVDLNLLETCIKRYRHILDNRIKHFEQVPSQDNFVRARASFDEIFATIMLPDLEYQPVPIRLKAFMESIGVTDETWDTF